MTLDPRSPEWQQIYEAGESNMQADFDFGLTEHAGWPDDVDVTPTAVAERMKALQDALRALTENDDPGIPGEITGDLSCYFCGGWEDLSAPQPPNVYRHEPDCPWVAARALLGPPKPEPEVVEHRRTT